MRSQLAAVWVLAFGLGGCSLLPSGAPTAREFRATADADGGASFVMVDLDLRIARLMSAYRRPGFSPLGSDIYRPSLVLKTGDVITTTVYEVSAIPLFGATPTLEAPAGKVAPVNGHIATLPAQVVEQDGTVPIPFGGAVKVSGLSPAEAGKAIAKALAGKATDPQVVVSLVSSSVNSASVNGDVNRATMVPLTIRGERLLDVIASAGGPKDPVYDTDVELIRGGRTATASLQQVVSDPQQNLRVRPGDSIVLVHNPRSFSVLGSALKVSQIDFNVEKVTLAEAVARSGGLVDAVADVGEIYLLRFEPRDVVRGLLAPGDPQIKNLDRRQPVVPVAYHLDYRAAPGYFVSQSVQMRDKDVVLFANAESVQLSKFAVILRNIAGIYYDFRGPEAATTTGRSGTTTTVVGGGAD